MATDYVFVGVKTTESATGATPEHSAYFVRRDGPLNWVWMPSKHSQFNLENVEIKEGHIVSVRNTVQSDNRHSAKLVTHTKFALDVNHLTGLKSTVREVEDFVRLFEAPSASALLKAWPELASLLLFVSHVVQERHKLTDDPEARQVRKELTQLAAEIDALEACLTDEGCTPHLEHPDVVIVRDVVCERRPASAQSCCSSSRLNRFFFSFSW